MAASSYRVACLTGCGTAPELMAEASRALDATARSHGIRVEQAHAPVGADALVRHGHAVSHAARTAFLGADAVLVADDDDALFAELSQELDLRARQTRVLFGSRADSVLLSPLGDDASAWTVRRAFALAASRRMRLAVVAGDAAWDEVVRRGGRAPRRRPRRDARPRDRDPHRRVPGRLVRRRRRGRRARRDARVARRRDRGARPRRRDRLPRGARPVRLHAARGRRRRTSPATASRTRARCCSPPRCCSATG